MKAFDVYRDAIAAEFRAVLWDSALVKQAGEAPATVKVKYAQPTDFKFGGAVGSQEHVIKYVAGDLPYLSEGDSVEFLDGDGAVIRAERFKVRQASIVSDDQSDDQSGYWKHALLTRTP